MQKSLLHAFLSKSIHARKRREIGGTYRRTLCSLLSFCTELWAYMAPSCLFYRSIRMFRSSLDEAS